MKLSRFGEKFTRPSGTLTLMQDIGAAMAGDPDVLMLGGGNPAVIADVSRRFRDAMSRLAGDEQRFDRTFGLYDSPEGHAHLRVKLAQMLNQRCGWPITEHNIALTNGSQNAFFSLFNMLAGDCRDGSQRRIVLPLAPEYIGYEDLSIGDPFFVSRRPVIHHLGERLFKYGVDFNDFTIPADAAAICVSRPTNPTGNVLTDNEIQRLDQLAADAGIPLIIDNAYGAPFPNIIHTDVTPRWNDNTIMCLSLSKIGLPACRTGIVVAREELIDALRAVNAITNLAPGSVGAALALDMIERDELLDVCQHVIKPHYARMAKKAVEWFAEAMGDTPSLAHKPEGAIFLWLWFPDLPIDSQQLYQRLKARGVIVVPGHYFFPGLSAACAGDDAPEGPWRHQHECIRVSYAQSEQAVQRGLKIIADEVKKAYQSNG